MEHLIAEDFSQDDFLAFLAKEKSNQLQTNVCLDLGPNIDFFTFEQIKELIDKFKEYKASNPVEESKEGEARVKDIF